MKPVKSDPLVSILKAAVAESKDRLVIVAGTGVSIAACGDQEVDEFRVARWDGLLSHGVHYGLEVEHALAPEDAEVVRMMIARGRPQLLVAAAEVIVQALKTKSLASYRRWLKESVGVLKPAKPELLRVLGAFPGVLATLNYDSLFEQALERKPLTWLDGDKDKLEDVLRGSRTDAVLHLHGYWDVPESVVLGSLAYAKVADDPHTQTVLKLFSMDRTLLFVGCRGTVTDPNFAGLVEWAQKARDHATHRHFVLCRQAEAEALREELKSAPWLHVVPYGQEFDELVPFLKDLLPAAGAKPSRSPAAPPRRSARPVAPSGCVSAYLKRLAEETRYLRLIGLGETLQIDLEIRHAYVPLRTVVARSLTGKHLGRFSRKDLREFEHVEDAELSRLFVVARQFKQRGAILLGEPGAGKTTGARQLCWLLSGGERAPADLGLPRGLIPVFLRLRNLGDAKAETALKDFVIQETRDPNAPDADAEPGPELWNRRQPTLWVFDGLDEVVSESVRAQASQRIQEFLRHRRRDYVLVTSRYQGYGQATDLGPGFVQFHVQPLEPAQVESFVDRWFQAAYGQLYPDSAKAKKEADADAAKLKRILRQEEYTIGGLRELRTNPLLLTVVCLVYHEEHALPRGRAALYDKCVRVLLESWRRGLYERRQAPPFDSQAAQRVLASLAWWMHRENETQADGPREDDRRGSPSAALDAMAEVVSAPLAEAAAKAGLGRDGRRFIERMRDESGILVAARPQCCSFLHLTFQEYLAATHAVEEGLAEELVERFGVSWWRETTLLALARATSPFAKRFFTALLGSPAWEKDLEFTARCLDESAVAVLEPFLKKLKHRKVATAVKVRLLHLLRQRDDPALLNACRKLAEEPDRDLASAAREILQRARGVGTAEVVGVRPARLAASDQPGEVRVDSRTGMAFVTIPAGEFQMGTARGGRDNERPVHRVHISKPFLLGKYAVTNQEYERFLKESKYGRLPDHWNNKNFNQPQQPVVGISWEEAQAFCRWAQCRLPTEGEWEYACRAGNPGAYCFGDDESQLEQYAWYAENSGRKSHPVGQKKPNAWGLYDMHGNVWEWCQDWYGPYRTGAAIDPTGAKRGTCRVLRGGAWYGHPKFLRSSCRIFDGYPSLRFDRIGFRCVWGGGSAP